MINIIIPNYNGLEHLDDCLKSLSNQKYKDFKIIIVDNASTDGSVEFIEKYFKEIKIVKLNINTGFAKAVNVGIEFSLKDINISHILLLNNDIECKENFIEELLCGFQNPETGSVACKMLNFYNRDIIDDAGDFIKSKGSPFARGNGEIDKGQYDNPGYIFGACAGAAIYKREVFENAGYFDEDFFAFYEDVDFNLRMQLYGFKCFYNPNAVCYHKRGATAGKNKGFEISLREKNLILLRIKNYPLKIYIMNLPFFFIARFRRYLLLIFRNGFKIFLFAMIGYLKGLKQIPSALKKRKLIQTKINVSIEYFENLFAK